MKQQITKQNVISTIDYFKAHDLIKSDDVATIGGEILNRFPLTFKVQYYMMVAKPNELQLYKLDGETFEYTGDVILLPFSEIKKAKTKRTSVFFGEQYFIIKHTKGKIEINTPDELFDYNQENNVNAMIDYFERNF